MAYSTDKPKINIIIATNPGVGSESQQFGLSTSADGANSVAIGDGAESDANYSVAIGSYNVVSSTAPNTISIGYSNVVGAGCSDSVAIGDQAVITAGVTNSIAIGSGAVADHSNAVVFGKTAATTKANAAQFGSGATPMGAVFTGAVEGQQATISAKTGDASLHATTDNSKVFTNTGAGALVTLTLPAAVAGKVYEFIVQNANGIKVQAVGDDTIRLGASVSAAAGFCSSTTVGNTVCLVAISATEWVARYYVGTWTVT